MRPPRIVNRGRIAPSSPIPIIDSGRTSWSSASAVSTIDTKSPEPNIAEQVNQKLEEDVVVPSLKKKIILCIAVACVLLIMGGILLGTLLPHGSSTPISVEIATTMSTPTPTSPPSPAQKSTTLITNATGSTTITTTTTTTTRTASSR